VHSLFLDKSLVKAFVLLPEMSEISAPMTFPEHDITASSLPKLDRLKPMQLVELLHLLLQAASVPLIVHALLPLNLKFISLATYFGSNEGRDFIKIL
jgi:hypothetical protein